MQSGYVRGECKTIKKPKAIRMHENSQMEQVQELWWIRPAQSACSFEWQQQ